MIRKEPRYTNRMPDRIPDAILCADIHLVERDYQAPCRTDSLWEKQWIKMDFISALQKKFSCPVLCAGDLFDFWKPSPDLLSETARHIPKEFYTIYGQHDVPQHSLDLSYKSGIHNLIVNGKVDILDDKHNPSDIAEGCSWGMKPTGETVGNPFKILVWHTTTYQGKELWPGAEIPMAATLLRKYPQYNLIVTGDNHKPFTESYQGRWLVNPGSMMRLTADQADHKPRVYLWYAEDNSINMVYLPIELNVITREHLDIKEQRDARIDAFITRLNGEYEAGLSFEENLERFYATNQIRESVKNIVYKSLES